MCSEGGLKLPAEVIEQCVRVVRRIRNVEDHQLENDSFSRDDRSVGDEEARGTTATIFEASAIEIFDAFGAGETTERLARVKEPIVDGNWVVLGVERDVFVHRQCGVATCQKGKEEVVEALANPFRIFRREKAEIVGEAFCVGRRANRELQTDAVKAGVAGRAHAAATIRRRKSVAVGGEVRWRASVGAA